MDRNNIACSCTRRMLYFRQWTITASLIIATSTSDVNSRKQRRSLLVLPQLFPFHKRYSSKMSVLVCAMSLLWWIDFVQICTILKSEYMKNYTFSTKANLFSLQYFFWLSTCQCFLLSLIYIMVVNEVIFLKWRPFCVLHIVCCWWDIISKTKMHSIEMRNYLLFLFHLGGSWSKIILQYPYGTFFYYGSPQTTRIKNTSWVLTQIELLWQTKNGVSTRYSKVCNARLEH